MKNKKYKWAGSEFSGSRGWDSLSRPTRDHFGKVYDLDDKPPETVQEAADYIRRRTEQDKRRSSQLGEEVRHTSPHKPIDYIRDAQEFPHPFGKSPVQNPSTSSQSAWQPARPAKTQQEMDAETEAARQASREKVINMMMETLDMTREEAVEFIEEETKRKAQESKSKAEERLKQTQDRLNESSNMIGEEGDWNMLNARASWRAPKSSSNIDFSYIYSLLKMAAKDVPEIYPSWVRKYPELDRYESLSEIKKEIPVEDYREETVNIYGEEDVEKLVKRDIVYFKNDILGELRALHGQFQLADKGASGKDRESKSKMFESFKLAVKELIKFLGSPEALEHFYTKIMNGENLSSALTLKEDIVAPAFPVQTPVGEQSKTIKLPKNLNLVSVLRAFLVEYKRYAKEDYQQSKCVQKLTDISALDSYARLNYRTSNYLRKERSSLPKMEIVFSKQPTDLLSMSIRGDWTSCQYLLKDKTKYNYKAIQSTISPYCGIIYLTSLKDYEGRGEEMIARSLVFLLEPDDGREPILHVSNVYTSYSDKEKIKNIFAESLQKHSPLKVDDGPLAYSGEYSFPAYETEHSPAGMVPYLDFYGSRDEPEYLPVKRDREERFSKDARRFNAYIENFCEKYSSSVNGQPSKQDMSFDFGMEACAEFLGNLQRFDQDLVISNLASGEKYSLQEFAFSLSEIIGEIEEADSNYEADRLCKRFYRNLINHRAAQL